MAKAASRLNHPNGIQVSHADGSALSTAEKAALASLFDLPDKLVSPRIVVRPLGDDDAPGLEVCAELKKIVHDPWLIESRRLGPFVPRIKEDGVILDVMIHDIDIILNLVRSPVRCIYALGNSIYTAHEDLANVQICFQNGCIANIIASRATEIKIRTMAITQRHAYIVLDYTDQDIRVHRQASSEHLVTRGALRYKQESLIERIFVHKENPLKLEIKHLIDCATQGALRVVSVDEELRSLQVALQVLEILEKDGLV